MDIAILQVAAQGVASGGHASDLSVSNINFTVYIVKGIRWVQKSVDEMITIAI